jgi:hypothetical protein
LFRCFIDLLDEARAIMSACRATLFQPAFQIFRTSTVTI